MDDIDLDITLRVHRPVIQLSVQSLFPSRSQLGHSGFSCSLWGTSWFYAGASHLVLCSAQGEESNSGFRDTQATHRTNQNWASPASTHMLSTLGFSLFLISGPWDFLLSGAQLAVHVKGYSL